MAAAGWGRIVNMSAGSSFVRNHGVYGLAKAGVSFLTEELALELGPSITVNAVAPGQIEESLPFIHAIDPGFGARYAAKAPLKKLVRRIDVAKLVSTLCSPLADMITGETIRIDGGAELPRF
jgi:3-oxoacyl-[acyl-carrier protein] reductase